MEETIGALQWLAALGYQPFLPERATHGAILARRVLQCSKIHRIFLKWRPISSKKPRTNKE